MRTTEEQLKKRGLWTTCDACGKEIYYGNASVTFNRNIEQMDHTAEHPDGVVTVIESSVLMILCGHCGNRFDAKRTTDVLKAVVNQPPHILN